MKVIDIMGRTLSTNIDLCLFKDGIVECFYSVPWDVNITEYQKVISAYGDLDVDYIRVNQDVLELIKTY